MNILNSVFVEIKDRALYVSEDKLTKQFNLLFLSVKRSVFNFHKHLKQNFVINGNKKVMSICKY